jgi:cytosine permease
MGEAKDVYGDYALTRVPEEARRSFWSIFMEFSGNIGCIAAIWGGGVMGLYFNVPDMIIATYIGCAIVATLGFLMSLIGGYSRATLYVAARYPFGRIGSMLMGLLPSGLGAGLAWFAYETWLFGVMINSIAPGFWWSNIAVASIWGGILMAITSFGGFAWLVIFSYLTAPLFFLLSFIGLGAAIDTYGGWGALMTAQPANPSTIIVGITATVGLYVCGSVISPDEARFGKKPTTGSWAWFLHVMIWMPILMLAGGFMTLLTGAPHIGEAMIALGMGIGAIVLTVSGQWKINDSNLWFGSLCWVNTIGWKITRRMWVVILGAIGTIWALLLSSYGASMQPFFNFVTFLGMIIPPIGGVMIADFFVIRPYLFGLKDRYRRYPFGPRTKYSIVNWVGILAVVLGYLLCSYTEPFPASLSSIIIAFLVYVVLMTICYKSKIPYEFGEWIERETGF